MDRYDKGSNATSPGETGTGNIVVLSTRTIRSIGTLSADRAGVGSGPDNEGAKYKHNTPRKVSENHKGDNSMPDATCHPGGHETATVAGGTSCVVEPKTATSADGPTTINRASVVLYPHLETSFHRTPGYRGDEVGYKCASDTS